MRPFITLACLLILCGAVQLRAEDADELRAKGIAALKESQANPRAIVDAARAFVKAAELYTAAGDEGKTVEMNSFLYWCKKKMSMQDIDAFTKGGEGAVSNKLAAVEKLAPQADEAQPWFDRAAQFAQQNPDEHLLIAIRFFEVADRFKGTDASLQAQDHSLKEQLQDKSSAAKPTLPPVAVAAKKTTEPDRTVVPALAAQKQSEKDIKELFKDDFRKTAAQDKATLARALIKQGSETREDSAARYTLWKLASDLTVQCGEVDTALDATHRLLDGFAIEDAISYETDVLRKLSSIAIAPAANATIANAALEVMARASESERYDDAIKLTGIADNASRKAQDASLALRVQAAIRASREIQTEFGRLKTAQQTLTKNAADPAANLLFGQFYCITKNDWQRGLPYLEKAANPGLRQAAQCELALGAAAEEVVSLADEWWAIGEKETGRIKDGFHKHAASLYRGVQPQTSGLVKTRIEKRIATVEEQIFLGDLKPKSVQVGNGEFLVNKHPAKLKMMVHGAPCNQYFFAHAPSDLKFDIPQNVDTFSATGIRPSGDANIWGSWKYRILLDGTKVYESAELKSVPEFEIPIWVTIPRGTKEITLEIDPLGDKSNDHSIWAFPMFHR